MSHRLFAQLAFERALGNAAIDALNQALNDKKHFATDNCLSFSLSDRRRICQYCQKQFWPVLTPQVSFS